MNLLPVKGMIRGQSAMRGLLVAVVVALLTFTVALFGGFLNATSVADEATSENERNLLQNHIGVSLRTAVSAQKVQLTWDEAVQAVGGQGAPLDAGWADSFIGQFLWSNLQAQHLFLVEPDGKLIRAWERGEPVSEAGYRSILGSLRDELQVMAANQSIRGKPASFRQLADTRWPIDEQGQAMSRWAGELGEYKGQPALITVVSVVPDSNPRLLKRTPSNLIAVRLLDAEMLAGFSSELLLKDMRHSTQEPAGGARNKMVLVGQDGQKLGWLSWTSNEVGAIVIRRTVPLLISYFIFYVLVLAGAMVLVRQAILMAREYSAREAQAQRSALHDPMLGLPNRTLVIQHLSRHLAEVAAADNDEAVFLAYLDLDHFKAINDSLGHHIGDALLFEVVKRLRLALIEDDLLGRLASDEFVVVRRTSPGKENAIALGEAVIRAFSDPFTILGQTLTVSGSCGISWGSEQAQNATELLRLADIALFRAKQRGRGRFRYFTEEMNATIRWRQDMEVELRRAIGNDSLEMYYQPIVRIADKQIISFEALVRWTHRHRGAISPGIFVPLAEQCGLMPQLGEWVLRRVFADSHCFGDTEISVNLSPIQIGARDFLPQLKALVTETGINPQRYVFEITEGVLLEKGERTLSLLGEISDMGFRIALDDFGTGYSSLAYLRSFQFDRIKIDRSFVQGIESDLDAQAILKAIVSLGRTLRMKVIAEGVETILQQQLVEASGCTLVQGHLHWRALSVDRAAALVGPKQQLPLKAVG